LAAAILRFNEKRVLAAHSSRRLPKESAGIPNIAVRERQSKIAVVLIK
jgi:hypothetical protein